MHHTCYCGQVYFCEYCGTPSAYICPTINDDEDGNLCSTCYEKMGTEMQQHAYGPDADEES